MGGEGWSGGSRIFRNWQVCGAVRTGRFDLPATDDLSAALFAWHDFVYTQRMFLQH